MGAPSRCALDPVSVCKHQRSGAKDASGSDASSSARCRSFLAIVFSVKMSEFSSVSYSAGQVS